MAHPAYDLVNASLLLTDHLVYGVPNLAAALDTIARLVGVRPALGGRHPHWGTANALLALGPQTYLEILGPDPDASTPPRLFGLDRLEQSRLIGWAVKATALDERIRRSTERGYRPGRIVPGSRRRPDGTLLRWRLVLPDDLYLPFDGLIPFLIDWQGTGHPASTAPMGCRLIALRAEHPAPEQPQALLDALDVALPVSSGPAPRLTATLDTPVGQIDLS